jgi:threonyl-tRNA synthetase
MNSTDCPIEIKRHSAAHVMAAAVKRLFPDVKLGVGPVIEYGFYYDIDIGRPVTNDDLKKIDKEMRAIVKENPAFTKEELDLDDAIKLFRETGQDYKVELLLDLKNKGTTKVTAEEAQDVDPQNIDRVTLYRTGEFTDLCRGPHVTEAKDIGVWKLHKVAGAYWRGDAANPQMQRIYGLCFHTKDELAAHLHMLEEAEKRDHRKIGAELDLFTFSPLVGSGLPLFTAKGVVLREEITKFIWELMQPQGYERVWIPHITKSDLYKTSGHWEKFEDDLFHVTSKKTHDEFVLKPMNCPHHTQIYASKPRSYRDLPIRMSEVTTVYRDENTGQLQGLTRVRSITQDDAHVFCRLDQVEDEVLNIYRIIEAFYKGFGMPLERIQLSVRDLDQPEKYLGDDAVWTEAEATLARVMEGVGREVEVGEGEAAFYGPKLDFMAKDAIGREHQLATIQLDFIQPERFSLEYADANGEKQRPVMIHRAVLGSVERFLGIAIEHFAGRFPLWLAPVQATLLPVADRHVEFAKTLADEWKAAGLRVHVDETTESVGKKIRLAEKLKTPRMIVIGDQEVGGGNLQIRVSGEEDQREQSAEDFLEQALQEIKNRTV